MRAWLLAAACVARLLAPCPAEATGPTAVEAAERAAASCKGEDIAAAVAALSELVAVLQAELGASHSATELAEMTLASLEGRRFEPRPSADKKFMEAVQMLQNDAAMADKDEYTGTTAI